jgi:hypothetical protein
VEKTTQRGALCSVLITKYYFGDQIKKNEMGRLCSTYEESCMQGFGGGSLNEDPGVDGKIILKWIFVKWDEVWTLSIWLRIGMGAGLL